MENDVQFAREAAPAQLKTVEGFLRASPDNEKMLAVLARGYCEYTFGFLQDDLETLTMAGKTEEAAPLVARATNLFLRCMSYGLRLLGEGWEKSIYGDLEQFDKRVRSAEKGQVPGMFWTALGLASAIDINRDDIELIVLLPKAIALFTRVVELNESYYNGGAHFGLGAFYTAQGVAMGGNPDKGKRHFERAIELTGGKYLMTKVLMALGYGTITQDRKFFHDTLEEVLATSPAIWPEQRLANELAHIRARRYLAHEKEWF